MIARPSLVLLGAMAALVLLAGCEPTKKTTAPWVNPLDVLEPRLVQDVKDNNYILQRMEFGRIAMQLGCDLRAKPRLEEAFEQLGAERSNTAAALTTEQLKYYKGETYERVMLATYLGTMEYRAGQYNNARIYFSRALSADRAAVVKDSTPAAYGDDFGLAYYWISRAFARLDDGDQCAIALRKAAARPERNDAAKELAGDLKQATEWEKPYLEGEAWAVTTFQNPEKPELYMEGIVNLADVRGTVGDAPAALPNAVAASPVVRSTDSREEFFTPAYQAAANTVLSVEVGRPPFKYLGGIEGERTEFGRSPVPPRVVRVYVDGHGAGQAFEVVDLWDQAATQDRIAEKDAAQAGKAVAKHVLSYMPYVGSAVGHWNVQGDVRHWTTLPGKVFVFAAQLAPGPHTVRLEMYDCRGNLLPRWTNTYYGIGVPAAGEVCLTLVPNADGDNRLPPDLVGKALKAGATPAASYGH
ncbi:MAG TPA: hypothetical protein VNA25_16350 [Phycisphaerae bacterium]|nr:hypothetical protein [Phycisphaerae bacterium]